MAAKDTSDVSIRVKMTDSAKLNKAARKSSSEMKGMGTAAEQAGKKGARSGKQWDRYGRSAKGAERSTKTLRSAMGASLKTMAGYGAAFAGFSALKGSVNVTKNFATSMMGLDRVLGSDAPKQAAEAYAGIFASRGIDTNKATMGFKTLSAQMIAAGRGSKPARKAFNALGIDSKFLAENSNDLDAITRKVADGLGGMDKGARRTKVGYQLFGKSYSDLVKVVGSGSEGMDEEIKTLRKWGVVTGKTTDDAAALAKAQRESKTATLGLQLMIGTQLLPVLLRGAQVFPQLVQKIKNGDGAFKTIRDTIGFVWGQLKKLVDWFSTSKTASDGLVYGLTALGAAFAIQKVVNFVSAIRKLWVVTKLMTVAQFALNLVLRANPIILVVTVLAALAFAFVKAYQKVRWFRKGVQDVWNWLKTNWPLIVSILGGPLGAAVVQVIKHWDSIKRGASSAVRWVGDKLGSLVGFVKGLGGKISGAASSIWDGLKGGLVSVLNWVIDKINGLTGAINKIPGVDIGKIAHVGGDAPTGLGPTSDRAPGAGAMRGVPRRAMGGYVPGTGRRDTTPLLATPGEFVIKQKAAEKIGARKLNQLNSGASGGSEGPVVFELYIDGKQVEATVVRRQQNRKNRK